MADGTDNETARRKLKGGADDIGLGDDQGPSGGLSNATATQTRSSTGSFSEGIADLDSDTEYEFRAVAEASDGDSDIGSALSFTTGGAGDGDSAPAIAEFSLTDDSNPAWTRYYVDWAVSDDDGDLASVTSELLDSGGSVLDSDSSAASGSSASGIHYVRSKSDAAEVRLTVADEAGTETSDAKSI